MNRLGSGERLEPRFLLATEGLDTHGDTLDTATTLPWDGRTLISVPGAISRAPRNNDVDMFRVVSSQSQVADIDLTVNSEFGLPVMRVFDRDGNQLAYRDATGPNAVAIRSFTFVADTEYFVAISGFPNTSYAPGSLQPVRAVTSNRFSYHVTIQPARTALTIRARDGSVVDRDAEPVRSKGTVMVPEPGEPLEGFLVRSFEINNPTGSPIDIAAVRVGGDAASEFRVLDGPQGTLQPGDTADMVVAFVPATLGAPRFAAIEVVDASGESLGGFRVRGEIPREVLLRDGWSVAGTISDHPVTIGINVFVDAGTLISVRASQDGAATARVGAGGLRLVDATGTLAALGEAVAADRTLGLAHSAGESGIFTVLLEPHSPTGRFRLAIDFQDGIVRADSGSDRTEATRVYRIEQPALIVIDASFRDPASSSSVSLFADNDLLLAMSAQRAPGARLVQHVEPGTYTVRIAADSGAVHALIDVIPATNPARGLVSGGTNPRGLVVADIDGDGADDIITANEDSQDISILLGVNRGLFRTPLRLSLDAAPVAVAVLPRRLGSDRSGWLPIVVALASGELVVLHVDASARLGAQRRIVPQPRPAEWTTTSLAIAPRPNDQDGTTTVAIGGGGSGSVFALALKPDGEVASTSLVAVGGFVTAVVFADLDRDGLAEMVVADGPQSRVVVTRLTQGRYSTEGSIELPVDRAPEAIAASDLDGDGWIDIVTANGLSAGDRLAGRGSVSVLWNEGDRRFTRADHAVGGGPQAVVMADIDNDGTIDILTGNRFTNDLSVLVGEGARQFADRTNVNLGIAVGSLAVARIDDDSLPDIVAIDYLPPLFAGRDDGVPEGMGENLEYPLRRIGDLVVLYGNGGGTFRNVARREVTGQTPTGIVSGDINGDGRADLIVTNFASGDVSVLLGRGDGTFADERRIPVSSPPEPGLAGQDAHARPRSVVVADFNQDGRLDMATANWQLDDASTGSVMAAGSVTVLLGMGTGEFAFTESYAVGKEPLAIAVGDLDRDGFLDLVVAGGDFTVNAGGSGQLTILRGSGDGGFRPWAVLPTPGFIPTSVAVIPNRQGAARFVAGLVRSDPRTPVQAATLPGEVVTVEYRAPGVFTLTQSFAVGPSPRALTIHDLDGDGAEDVVVADSITGDVRVLWRNTAGKISATSIVHDVGNRPTAVAVLRSEPRITIVTANFLGSDASFLPLENSRARQFGSMRSVPVVDGPAGVAIGDFDGDGVGDVAVAHSRNGVHMLLNAGQTTPEQFVNATSYRVAMIAGQGGTASLGGSGDITVRADNGTVLDRTLGGPFVDFTILSGANGVARIAAIDKSRGAVVIEAPRESGRANFIQLIPAVARSDHRAALSRIAAADLNGDGLQDLIVTNPGNQSIDIMLAAGSGYFDQRLWQSIPAGPGVTNVLLTDINRDGTVDLVMLNQVSGDVSIRLGIPGVVGTLAFHPGDGFGSEVRYRTSSSGTYGFASEPFSERRVSVAPFRLSDLAVGDFNGDGLQDIVVVNATERTFTILLGQGGGLFGVAEGYKPLIRRDVWDLGPIYSTRPEASELEGVAAADLDGDGRDDLIFLDVRNQRVSVYRSMPNSPYGGNGVIIDLAGASPKSIQVADVAGDNGGPDGILDLVVGNDFGDVLVLQGRGDGSFKPVVRVDQSVALVAVDIDGDGREELIYGNAALDRVSVERPSAGQTRNARRQEFQRLQEANRRDGVLGPNAVAIVTEPGSGLRHLAVVNGGSNEVLLFRRAPAGSAEPFLRPERFFVGTNPTAIAMGDVDGDGIPDIVVANSGSDDLSVLRGRFETRDGVRRYSLMAGVRLKTGGTRPDRIALADVVGVDGRPGQDGRLDVVVTNRGGQGNAAVLRGIAGGFFADASPTFLPLPPGFAPGPIAVVRPPAGRPPQIVIGSPNDQFTAFGQAGGRFTASFSSSAGGSSLATTPFRGETLLAAGNSSLGSVSFFLTGPSGFRPESFQAERLGGLAELAFDATGRLFGVSPASASALALFQLPGTGASTLPDRNELFNAAQSFAARLVFTPLRAAGVALVATLVTTDGLDVADAVGEPQAADGEADRGDGSADVAGGTRSPVAEVDESAPREENPLLEFFLDIEGLIERHNRRLIEWLLEGAPLQADGVAATPVARLLRRVMRAHAAWPHAAVADDPDRRPTPATPVEAGPPDPSAAARQLEESESPPPSPPRAVEAAAAAGPDATAITLPRRFNWHAVAAALPADCAAAVSAAVVLPHADGRMRFFTGRRSVAGRRAIPGGRASPRAARSL